jgi:hypothetical protein
MRPAEDGSFVLHLLLIVFGMIFAALYGVGIGLAAAVWWLAGEPVEAEKTEKIEHGRSDAA